MDNYSKYQIRQLFERQREKDDTIIAEAIERLETTLGRKSGMCLICCNVDVLDNGLCTKCVNYRQPYNGKPYKTWCEDCGMTLETNITDSVQAVVELLRDGWHDSKDRGWLCPECAGLL